MTTNFIHGIIRRSNFYQFLLALVIIIAVIGAAVLARNFYYNLFSGPFDISKQSMLKLKSPDGLSQYYVTIKGDDVIDTGYQQVSRNYGIETGHESYVALMLDDQFLLVQVSGEASDSIQYSGAIQSIPSDVQREVLDQIIAEVPEVKGRFLPVMLGAGDFRLPGFLAVGATVLVALGGLYLLARVIQRMTDPSTHPIMRGLARFGDAEQTADQIEGEMNQDHPTVGKKTHLTRNWLIHRTGSTLQATRLSDITWMYKHVTQHRTNFIPTGKTFKALIWDRSGVCIEIQGKEKEVLAAMEAVAQRTPWSIIGYKPELEQAWKKDRSRFIAAVDQRRSQAGSG